MENQIKLRNMSPFVKWVGGKRQLLKKIDIVLENIDFDRIVEPFVGGGAFFIKHNDKFFLINDINEELISAYETIRDNHLDLIKKLKFHEKKHSEKYFYEIRKKNINRMNKINKSARFIYLNKSCFNGMYRVNSKGKFNVPFGKKEKINLFSENNISLLSDFFNKKNCEIKNENYKFIFNQSKENDLFFIDPPYDKETKTSFVSYNKNNFNSKDQEELFDEIKSLNKKNIKFITTNHNTKLINDLYKDFLIIPILVNRSINSDGNKRKKSSTEVIITNINLNKNQIKRIKE